MDLGEDAALLRMRAQEEAKLQAKLEAVRAREAEMRRLDLEDGSEGSYDDDDDDEEEDGEQEESNATESTVLLSEHGAPEASLPHAHLDTAGEPKTVADLFKIKDGEWDCAVCYTRNKATSPSICASCEAKRPAVDGDSSGGDVTQAETSKHSYHQALFGSGGATTADNADLAKSFFGGAQSASSGPFSFGGSHTSTPITSVPAPTFGGFPASVLGGNGSNLPLAGSSPVLDAAADASANHMGASNIFGTSITSIFGGKNDSGSSGPITFGAGAAAGHASVRNESSLKSADPQGTYSKADSKGGAASASLVLPVDGGHPSASGVSDRKVGVGSNGEKGTASDQGPLVSEEVVIKTGEEDEDVLFGRRAKMFRFDAEKREWKERGVGDVKLLIHRDSHQIRVLMRRDHTFKVCANHVVTADLKIEAMAGSDKALTYYTVDSSGINAVGEYTGEVATELFAFRFKTAAEYLEWKDALQRCQQGDLSGFHRVSGQLMSCSKPLLLQPYVTLVSIFPARWRGTLLLSSASFILHSFSICIDSCCYASCFLALAACSLVVLSVDAIVWQPWMQANDQ